MRQIRFRVIFSQKHILSKKRFLFRFFLLYLQRLSPQRNLSTVQRRPTAEHGHTSMAAMTAKLTRFSDAGQF